MNIRKRTEYKNYKVEMLPSACMVVWSGFDARFYILFVTCRSVLDFAAKGVTKISCIELYYTMNYVLDIFIACSQWFVPARNSMYHVAISSPAGLMAQNSS